MRTWKRNLPLSFVVTTLLACAIAPVAAQQYPTKPIEFITPFPPGGISDTSFRVIEQFLAKELNGSLVNINKAGAAGQVGAEFVLRAPKDGYTVYNGANPIFTTARAMRGNQVALSANDFVPIGSYTLDPTILVVRKDSPIKNMKDLVAYAKANAGKLSSGDGGIGGAGHFTMEALNLVLGMQIKTAHFQGALALIPQVLGGHVDMVLAGTSTFLAQIKSGELVALAITAKHPDLPNVPTVSEVGAAEAAFQPSQGLYVAQGTPKEISDKLSTALATVMKNPQVIAALIKAGLLPQYLDGPQTAKALEVEYQQAVKIANTLGLVAK